MAAVEIKNIFLIRIAKNCTCLSVEEKSSVKAENIVIGDLTPSDYKGDERAVIYVSESKLEMEDFRIPEEKNGTTGYYQVLVDEASQVDISNSLFNCRLNIINSEVNVEKKV